MPTSKPPGSGGGPPANSYTRFIPREELGSFSAWNPNSLEDPGAGRKPAPGESPAGGGVYKAPFAVRAGMSADGDGAAATQAAKPAKDVPPKPANPAAAHSGYPAKAMSGRPADKPSPPPPPPAPPPVDVEAIASDARHAGYQDGYRDGLAALDSYKQTQAAQMAAFMSDQVGSIVNDLHARLDSLEQQLSGRIAGVALELARQVVRSEISLRPELVVTVAEEALNTLLSSARQVTLSMHPDDYALAKGALTEQLQARGARVMSDPHVSPGGCVVGSDIAVVDARIEARWLRAAAAMGASSEWGEAPVVPAFIEADGERVLPAIEPLSADEQERFA